MMLDQFHSNFNLYKHTFLIIDNKNDPQIPITPPPLNPHPH